MTHPKIARSDLPYRAIGSGVEAAVLNGKIAGLGTVSLMFGEVQPGARVALHRHTYEEVFVITSGRGAFTIGDTTVDVEVGDIVVVPAGVPHTFRNTGSDPLCQTAVHAAAEVAIEWLETPS
ncbi:MAG: cupin domain-containing protein [Chloroflexi bacterium]|nr:MAG: cupin domain-containing protein [Chloroflexota bacterium]